MDQYALDTPNATGASSGDSTGNPGAVLASSGSGSSTGSKEDGGSSGGDGWKYGGIGDSDGSFGSGGDNGTTGEDGDPSTVGKEAHAVPVIAADAAGDGWVPFLLAGLAAIGALGAYLVYRRRRAQI